MFVPTEKQLAARDRFLTGESLKIKAFAGCGKTATLEFMARSGGSNGLYVAFNTAIAKESAAKFRGRATCTTTHALALRHLPPAMKEKANRGLILRSRQLAEFIQRRCGCQNANLFDQAKAVYSALSQFCRSADRFPAIHHVHACEDHLLRAVEVETVLRDLNAVWASIADPGGELPLTHDSYLKWFQLFGGPLPFAHVFVDEAQDLAPVIVDLFKNSGLQTVWVGDPYQELYAWNGAENAMESIDDVEEVVLSQCFRFGPKLAEIATGLLVDLGEYTPLIGNKAVQTVIAKRHQPVRIVRNNMTLLAKAVHLSKRNKVFVLGDARRLEELVADANALIAGKRVIAGQLSKFSTWADVQDRAYGRRGHPYTEFVKTVDEIGCDGISRIVSRLSPTAGAADITLTTVHGSKGCQFDSVSVYDDFRGAKERGMFLERMPAEVTRLLYVAITRAKHALFMDRSLADRFNLTQILLSPTAEPEPEVPAESPEIRVDSRRRYEQPGLMHCQRSDSPAAYSPPRYPPKPSRSSIYTRYGDVAVGVAIGLFLWIAFH